MSWGLGEAEPEELRELDSGVKLDLGEALGYKSDEIINVPLRVILSTLAMIGTGAVDTEIEGAWERRNTSAEHVNNRPNNPLCCQRRRAIAKTKGGIDVDFSAPTYCEEHGGDGVEYEPAVPSSKIQLEDEDSLARVPLSRPLYPRDDRLGVWKGKFPVFPPVNVGVNEAVDAPIALGAIDHSAPCSRILLGHCIERAAESFEGKICILEWTHQSAELEFLIDVGLDVLFEQGGALQIPLGVARSWMLGERYVPAVTKPVVDFLGVKISSQSPLPIFERE